MNTGKATLLLVLSSALFSLMSALIRFAADIDVFKTTLFRFAIGMALLGTLAITKKIDLNFTKSWLLMLRGLFGGIAVFMYFLAINRIGLASGTVISNIAPIFATIFSAFILKEKISLLKWLLIITTFLGVFLIIGTSAKIGSEFNFYHALALIGAMFAGLAYITIKLARETESAYSIFFAQSVIGFWIVVIPANIVPVEIGIDGGIILLCIGITAAMGQLLMTHAYKFTPVSTGSLMGMLTPVFNVIIAFLVFREEITITGAIGMVIVLASCYLMVIGDSYMQKIMGIFTVRN